MSFHDLRDISSELVEGASQLGFTRSGIIENLDPPKGCAVILRGPRGIGKTTAILQYLSRKISLEKRRGLYLSADSAFLTMGLMELAKEFNTLGGEFLAVDEIHKYPQWDKQIKTILDSFPKIRLIVSGSSALSMDKTSADLSRRHVLHDARGLSFREFVCLTQEIDLGVYGLKQIIAEHSEISHRVYQMAARRQVSLTDLFKTYLREGYFPTREDFDSVKLYQNSLQNMLSKIIDEDIANSFEKVDRVSRNKIKRLLGHIAHMCPFTPNIRELADHLNIGGDNTLKRYLWMLNEGGVIRSLYQKDRTPKDFPRPQKIFLENTNFMYAFGGETNIGSVRETFAANALSEAHNLTSPNSGDFCVDDEVILEIGGKGKSQKQIRNARNGYVFADDITHGEGRKIPLWMLGLLW